MLCLSEALPQELQGMQTFRLKSAQAEQRIRTPFLLTQGALDSDSMQCSRYRWQHMPLQHKGGLHGTRSWSRDLMHWQAEENLDQSGQVASTKSADEHDCTCCCQVLSTTKGHCRGLRRS